MLDITEAVLEMHFHHELMDSIRGTLGLGKGGRLNFYKYSQQKECFVGFDQAFVESTLTPKEMFDLLYASSTARNYNLNNRFFGYFLQYKVVHRLNRLNDQGLKHIITNRPFYRVSLDTKINPRTNRSQHELLYMLALNRGALVYYACPMIFEQHELYDKVNLDKLNLVQVDSLCPANTARGSHSIYFNSASSVPHWCSEPSPTKFQNIDALANKIKAGLFENVPDQWQLNFFKWPWWEKYSYAKNDIMQALTIVHYEGNTR